MWVVSLFIVTSVVLSVLYTKYKKATLGTMQEALHWAVDVWSVHKPDGYETYTVLRGGYTGAIGIKDASGVVVYHVRIWVRQDSIHVEAKRGRFAEPTVGKIYAFLPFVNAGLKAMGVAELEVM